MDSVPAATAEPSPSISGLSGPVTFDESLDAITGYKRYLELTEKLLKREVLKARSLGATWPQIAQAYGVSAQGARQRWAKFETKALVSENANGAQSPNGSSGAADHAGGEHSDPAPGTGAV